MPPATPRAIDEPYDRNDPSSSHPVLRQRQQHLRHGSSLQGPSNSQSNNPQVRSHSRRSASSSSTGRQLRRVSPRLEDTRLPRSASARTAPRHHTNLRSAQRPVAPAVPAPQRPALSEAETEADNSSSRESEHLQSNESYWPRRSTRVSPRTASAILWVLEEAIRQPFEFTPYLEELNASMSDLIGGGQVSGSGGGNGRAYNAGSRTAQGPVPVQTQPQTSGVRTPTDIMRQRRDREARKKAEQEAKERDQQEAERRTARDLEKKQQELYQLQQQQQQIQQQAAGVAGETTTQRRAEPTRTTPAGDTTYTQDPSTRVDRGAGRTAAPQTTGATAIPPSAAMAGTTRRPDASPSANTPGQQQYRPRGATVSQGQPRTVPAPSQPQQHTRTTSAYAGQPSQQPSQPRAPPASAQAAPQPEPSQTQQQTQAPSASQPTTQQSQQNRPRATFPHAFERWESLSSHWEGLTSYWIRKLEQNGEELNSEPLNRQLSRQVTDLSAAGANLFHAVVELQRLRASSERKFQRWFFDTRAEQEKAREVQAELEKQLKAERQSRTDSSEAITKAEAERAKAEEATKEMRRELQISKEEARRAWEELGRREQEERDRTASLRNGEPTLVGGVQVVPMMQGVPSRQTSTNRPPTREGPYPGGPGSAAMGGQSRHTEPEGDYPYEPQASSPTETDPFTEPTLDQSRPVYRGTDPQGLGASPSRQPARSATTTAPAEDIRFYQHEGTALHGAPPRVSEVDERSFVPSTEGPASDLGSEDYPSGQNGTYGQDSQGRRVFYPRTMSDDSEEYEIQDQLEREHEFRQRYGDVSGPGYGGSTATSGGQGRPGFGDGVDYSGTGWGAETGWESVTPRHRHPTRLSDVLEEDERSRTSASRASQASRTMMR